MDNETHQFLAALFDGLDDGDWFYLWTLHDKTSHWYLASHAHLAASHQVGQCDVYVGPAFGRACGTSNERIKAENTAGIVGLWADIDYHDGDIHKKTNIPANADVALAIIRDIPLRPTIIVWSGHGFQCWWLFEEPWRFDTASERDEAKALSRRWGATIKSIAALHGAQVDSVFDLARVMRVPGTYNAKRPEQMELVIVREQSGERYNPSDFEPYLIDDPQPVGDEPVEVTLTGEISDALQPDMQKFMALYTNDSSFRAFYEHKKKPANDDSMSGYDLALANIAVRVGWTNEEILALLVQHRRQHGDLVKHAKYYELTIAKARNQYRAEASINALANEASMASSEGVEAAPEPPAEGDILKSISDMLGVPVAGLIEYTSTPPTYRLLLESGDVFLGGAEVFVNQNRFRTKVLEIAGVLPTQLKGGTWTNLVNLLMRVRERQDTGDDTTESGRFSDLMHAYLSRKRVTRDDMAHAIETRSPFVHEGRICFFSTQFKQFIRDDANESIDRNTLAAWLTKEGVKTETIYFERRDGHRTSTSVRILPRERFKPDDYLPGY